MNFSFRDFWLLPHETEHADEVRLFEIKLRT